MWHVAYAPSQLNKMTRMQELHRLNNELDYRISHALFYRIVFGAMALLAIRKLGKSRYLNNGEQDSHEIDLKSTTATM